jgi:hypothetical protein
MHAGKEIAPNEKLGILLVFGHNAVWQSYEMYLQLYRSDLPQIDHQTRLWCENENLKYKSKIQ